MPTSSGTFLFTQAPMLFKLLSAMKSQRTGKLQGGAGHVTQHAGTACSQVRHVFALSTHTGTYVGQAVSAMQFDYRPSLRLLRNRLGQIIHSQTHPESIQTCNNTHA
jgi:hypothetical protein